MPLTVSAVYFRNEVAVELLGQCLSRTKVEKGIFDTHTSYAAGFDLTVNI